METVTGKRAPSSPSSPAEVLEFRGSGSEGGGGADSRYCDHPGQCSECGWNSRHIHASAKEVSAWAAAIGDLARMAEDAKKADRTALLVAARGLASLIDKMTESEFTSLSLEP